MLLISTCLVARSKSYLIESVLKYESVCRTSVLENFHKKSSVLRFLFERSIIGESYEFDNQVLVKAVTAPVYSYDLRTTIK